MEIAKNKISISFVDVFANVDERCSRNNFKLHDSY